VGDGLTVAGATGRLQVFDFRFDITNQYTFWSGTIAALFLFCSYFGTDQSQVQRYLTARSVDEARHSLFMSAYWKIPLQLLVLLLGIFVFTFHVFQASPLLFSERADQQVRERAPERYRALEDRYAAAFAGRREAALTLAGNGSGGQNLESAQRELVARDDEMHTLRQQARELVRQTTGDASFDDVNYIIPSFILRELPIGLVGLLILAILLAATDTIAAELNSLSTSTVIDMYRRWARPAETDAHYLGVSKIVTGLWGLFACVVAVWAAELGSLIEVVNRFGSFFYGSLLGVFILAIGVRRANGHGAFVGLIAGMTAVALTAAYTDVAFLWHNVVGAVTVVLVGSAVSAFAKPRRDSDVVSSYRGGA
jgi:Na+/proline symporter